jgi:hypothetical protein
VDRLRDASPAARRFREAVFKLFRDPASYVYALDKLPPFYGDGVDYDRDLSSLAPDASAELTLTPTLYRMMRQWAAGDFIADWKGFPEPPDFAKLDPSDQRLALDRANLYDILGGPFHPGIELTWIMRQPRLWKAPYRLKLTPEGTRARQDFGPELTPEICLGLNGPLSETGAGALTRWMGVPWQTDGGSCSSGGEYTPTFYLSIPSFWGARVPNDVLPQAAYERLKASHVSAGQRAKHFDGRAAWYRSLNTRGGLTNATAMIAQWPHLGLIEPVEPPHGYTAPFHVEISPHDPPGEDPTLALMTEVEALPGTTAASLRAAASTTVKTFRPARIHYRRGEV